jgi:hypothetical protein
VGGTKPPNQTGTEARVQLGGGLRTGRNALVLLSAAHSKRSKSDVQIFPADIEANGNDGCTAKRRGDCTRICSSGNGSGGNGNDDMAARGFLLRDKGMVLAFAATAMEAKMFAGGVVGVCTIDGMARRELGLIKLCKY